MAGARSKVFEYAVSLDDGWAATSDRGGDPLPHDEAAWTPEHLLLAALARCSLTSLVYHVRRAGLSVTARADASGTVTRRDEDGRFAFVEMTVAATATVTPPPDREAVRALADKAERDCFVGASLAATPQYRWTINGEEIA